MAVMIDLETLGLVPGCVVISIGAMRFEPMGEPPAIERKNGEPVVDGGFYEVIDRRSCEDAGLRSDPKVEAWWGQQAPEVREAVFNVAGVPLADVVERFAVWYSQPDELVWANGAAFDQPIWEAACRALGKEPPWHFRGVRCFRTLVGLLREADRLVIPEDAYPRHHALFDCYRQVLQAQHSFRKLGG